ncbi:MULTISPECIES: hypothetical protein [unclassified Kitasatospora]
MTTKSPAGLELHPHEYPLPALTLETAGEAIGEIAADLTTAAQDSAPPSSSTSSPPGS